MWQFSLIKVCPGISIWPSHVSQICAGHARLLHPRPWSWLASLYAGQRTPRVKCEML